MKTTVTALVLALCANALADPRVEDIVQRARTVAAKKAEHVTCSSRTETLVLDSDGKVEHRDLREGTTTFDGDKTDDVTLRMWTDGKLASAAEMKTALDFEKTTARESKSSFPDNVNASPFDGARRFELLRHEPLWGHDAYVFKVSSTGDSGSNGTMWIDAATFVALKSELVPAKLPANVDRLSMLEQHVLVRGAPVQSLVHASGAGHFLLFRKGFETTMTWSRCK